MLRLYKISGECLRLQVFFGVRGLFVSEGEDGVDAGGALGGDVAGEEGDSGEDG